MRAWCSLQYKKKEEKERQKEGTKDEVKKKGKEKKSEGDIVEKNVKL